MYPILELLTNKEKRENQIILLKHELEKLEGKKEDNDTIITESPKLPRAETAFEIYCDLVEYQTLANIIMILEDENIDQGKLELEMSVLSAVKNRANFTKRYQLGFSFGYRCARNFHAFVYEQHLKKMYGEEEWARRKEERRQQKAERESAEVLAEGGQE